MTPEEEATLAAGDPAFHEVLDHLSTYLDASWGDRADPALDGAARAGGSSIWDRLAARAAAPVAAAIDLGTSVGRGIYELARGAKYAVGVDTRLMSLRRARRLLAGERMPYARRRVGRFYDAAAITGWRSHASALCADALDPPFAPASFDRVAAINLLDAVARPTQLLLVVDGLCASGGEVIVTSPFAWSSEVTPVDAQQGAGDPASWLRRTFAEGVGLESRYTIEEEAELEWWLRHSARAVTQYRVYYLRARKGA
jgi:hypothetical protein